MTIIVEFQTDFEMDPEQFLDYLQEAPAMIVGWEVLEDEADK